MAHFSGAELTRGKELSAYTSPLTCCVSTCKLALEHLGSETYVHLACDNDEPLVLKSTGDIAIKLGQRVSVAVPPHVCYLFDETGTALPRPG